MKSKIDLVQGWLLKAESDLANVRMCLTNNQSLDTACFHAQQAGERFIKAYLTEQEIDFPLIHNLEKLIELCATREPSFQSIKTLGQELTPYAVALRYDSEFWPDLETAQQALETALKIKSFVLDKLSPETKEGVQLI